MRSDNNNSNNKNDDDQIHFKLYMFDFQASRTMRNSKLLRNHKYRRRSACRETSDDIEDHYVREAYTVDSALFEDNMHDDKR